MPGDFLERSNSRSTFWLVACPDSISDKPTAKTCLVEAHHSDALRLPVVIIPEGAAVAAR
jgi:hypothetical protein